MTEGMASHRPRRAALGLASLALALVVAACGSGDGGTTSPAAAEEASARQPRSDVVAGATPPDRPPVAKLQGVSLPGGFPIPPGAAISASHTMDEGGREMLHAELRVDDAEAAYSWYEQALRSTRYRVVEASGDDSVGDATFDGGIELADNGRILFAGTEEDGAWVEIEVYLAD